MRGRESGQTLIEVIVALAAAIAVISAIAITVITSLQNVEYTKNQNLATQYANEGIEIVKRIGRSNWSQLTAKTTRNYCLDKGSTTLTDPSVPPDKCTNLIDNVYSRQITIVIEQSSQLPCGGNVEVVSKVSWVDSKCTSDVNQFCHNVSLVSCLANINTTQAP